MHSWQVALVCLMFAGCLEGADFRDALGEEEQNEARGEFWMVLIEGEEDRKPMTYSCDLLVNHRVDVDSRTIYFAEEYHSFEPSNVSALFAFEIFYSSGCPAAYSLRASSEVHEETTAWGNLDFKVSPEGVVTGEGLVLQPGELGTLQTNHEGTEITLRVHNYGAWPQSGLHGEQTMG